MEQVERVIPNELYLDEGFYKFLENNFLMTNGPSLLELVQQQLARYKAQVSPHLKQLHGKYLKNILDDVIGLYRKAQASRSSSFNITFSYPPSFPIRQNVYIPKRTISDAERTRQRKQLDALFRWIDKQPRYDKQRRDDDESCHTQFKPIDKQYTDFATLLEPSLLRYTYDGRYGTIIFSPLSINALLWISALHIFSLYAPRGIKDKGKYCEEFFGAFLFLIFYMVRGLLWRIDVLNYSTLTFAEGRVTSRIFWRLQDKVSSVLSMSVVWLYSNCKNRGFDARTCELGDCYGNCVDGHVGVIIFFFKFLFFFVLFVFCFFFFTFSFGNGVFIDVLVGRVYVKIVM